MTGPWDELVLLHGVPTRDLEATDRRRAIVALTPDAYQWAADRALGVSIIDDHVDRRHVLADPHPYLRWQADWVRRVDDAFACDGAAVTAALTIKTPLDSLVDWARLLAALVDAVRPTRVTFVGPIGDGSPWHNGHLQFWPLLGDRPLAAELLPLVAARVGADVLVQQTPAAQPLPPADVRARLRSRVGRFLGPWRQVRPGLSAGRDACLMLWSWGYGATEYASGLRESGRHVDVLLRGRPVTRFIDTARPWRRTPPVAVAPVFPPVPDESLQPFLSEIDSWAGVAGAGRILSSRLAGFVGGVAPQVGRAASALEQDLRSWQIAEVAAANPSSVEEFAVLLAAKRQGARRTLVQHGDHLFPYDFWLVTETHNFDRLLYSDPTVPDDMAKTASDLGLPAPDFEYATPRLLAVRERKGEPSGDAVVYVPAPMTGDSVGPDGTFDDAWYHRWHLRLLEVMARHTDVRFIWKGLPDSDQARDPIPSVIAERHLPNVEYRAESFVRVLPEAGRVIIDFPSTALFETVHAGRPVLALAFERFSRLRPSASALFAPVLRVCAGEDAAVEYIDEFLVESPEKWILPASVLEHA